MGIVFVSVVSHCSYKSKKFMPGENRSLLLCAESHAFFDAGHAAWDRMARRVGRGWRWGCRIAWGRVARGGTWVLGGRVRGVSRLEGLGMGRPAVAPPPWIPAFAGMTKEGGRSGALGGNDES